MNFVSGIFVLFLGVLAILFTLSPKRFRALLLLAASYLFYATWSIPFLAIILLSTSTDYWFSKIIEQSHSPQKRKMALVAGLVFNLAVLLFFKYSNFFLASTASLYHWMGLPFPLPTVLHIILPLGISFYTFEAISYLIDVYRGGKHAKNWWEYNFYIMYFPHLISGPIIRFNELVHQYRTPLELPSLQRVAQGMELVVLGFLFKIVIADQAAGLVDEVFSKPEAASVLATYIAALAFTVQIYFDFMGYTHIARGVSLLFNIELPLNFNFPYLAQNISDFWKRWHISLSRWIRDYLYIPLGGSRGTLLKTATVLIITMTLCGAWHGAGWPYIIWGAYHGVLLAFCHMYKGLKRRMLPVIISDSMPYKLFSVGITFACVVIGWVLFRASDLSIAIVILQKLANIQTLAASIIPERSEAVFQLVLLLSICFMTPGLAMTVRNIYTLQPLSIRTALASTVLLLCWIMSAKQQIPFIYFQF